MALGDPENMAARRASFKQYLADRGAAKIAYDDEIKVAKTAYNSRLVELGGPLPISGPHSKDDPAITFIS